MLFQTGYLTVKDRVASLYTLGYPNEEVRQSMSELLLSAFSHQREVSGLIFKMYEYLSVQRYDSFVEVLNSLLSGVPYEVFMERYESFYHAIFYLAFSMLGVYALSEVHTSRGRIDVVVEIGRWVYVIEFKVGEGGGEEALRQIKERGYYQRYMHRGKEVVLMGLGCYQKQVKEIRVEKV
ncbi:MAG: PD-(D/E)XK nuclease domain-containing protein [Bernardetiaceae bacterium]|nr:PD-(D/E)XK nuclease domain-containing protein [Bernardetiaceae bacterium]